MPDDAAFYRTNGWVDPYPHVDFDRPCTQYCCERLDPTVHGEKPAKYPWTCDDGRQCKAQIGRLAKLSHKGICDLCFAAESDTTSTLLAPTA
jgi:hypothetical protein